MRREVTRRGEELVSRKFAPLLKPETSMSKRDFNYAVAVFTEWRGRSFYLCTRYRTPKGRPVDEFVVRAHGWNTLAEVVFIWRLSAH